MDRDRDSKRGLVERPVDEGLGQIVEPHRVVGRVRVNRAIAEPRERHKAFEVRGKVFGSAIREARPGRRPL